jgi:uncharacterized Zn finger protein
MSYWEYPKYISVSEKKAKIEKKLKSIKKKRPDIEPIVIKGNTLARTWWAKSWNKNLERYADYENRIGRGRSYVRHGAVLDLKISPGKVRGLVQGSGSKPYEVLISIKAIKKTRWKEIQAQCGVQLRSLQDLLAGKFPKPLAEIFFDKGNGVFPEPKAISFDCSCPDWAIMCKHVAATLYGIGARFDEDPSLFFHLRGVDIGDLVDKTVEDTTDKILANAQKKSSNVLDNANLSDLFGIDMDVAPNFDRKAEVIQAADVAEIKTKTKNVPQNSMVEISQKSGAMQNRKGTATSLVAELIFTNSTGISIDKLLEKTGYKKTKLYGIVQRLKKQGKIRSKSRGVYIKS